LGVFGVPSLNFLGVIEKIARWWKGMKGFIGMTRFTRLGLTIRNTIGKFSGGGLGYD
jgi:hypothetical protein